MSHHYLFVVYVIAAVSCPASGQTKRAKSPMSTALIGPIATPSSVSLLTGNGPQPCTAAVDDVPSRTVLASFVFEGRVVRTLNSSSVAQSPPNSGGVDADVDVVFTVTRAIKGDMASPPGSAQRTPIVVVIGPFTASTTSRTTTADRCADRQPVLPPVTGGVAQQQVYLVFASSRATVAPSSQLDDVQFRYRVAGAPIRTTKQALKDAQTHSCSNCAKRPSGVQLKASTVRPIVVGSKWHLDCKGQGKPAPTFVWYKDGVEFSTTSAKGIQIKSTKRGSKLSSNKATESDGGSYKCRAVNVVGVADSKAISIQLASTAGQNATAKPHYEQCPQQGFCQNGGTCFLSSGQSPFCRCQQTFTGKRCEEKYVSPDQYVRKLLDSDFPFQLDVFVIIALSAIALTVSLATLIFVCCTLSGLRRPRSASLPVCKADGESVQTASRPGQSNADYRQQPVVQTDISHHDGESMEASSNRLRTIPGLDSNGNSISAVANGNAPYVPCDEYDVKLHPPSPSLADHRRAAERLDVEDHDGDNVDELATSRTPLAQPLLRGEVSCNSRGAEREDVRRSVGGGARTSLLTCPYDSDPDATVV